MSSFLKTSIEFLKGVGPQRAEILRAEAGIHTYDDLLNYFPFRYVDRSKYSTIREAIHSETPVQLRGYLTDIRETGVGRGKRLTARFTDESGAIELIWFQGIKWVLPTLKVGVEYRIYGKGKLFGMKYSIPHPEVTPFDQVDKRAGLQPIYPSTEKLTAKGLNSRGFEKLTQTLIDQLPLLPESLPNEILNQYRLLDRTTAYKQIHVPANEMMTVKSRGRLKFEELFYLQMELLLKKQITATKNKGFIFPTVGDVFNDFYATGIPFELTGAQKRVIKEVRNDFRTGNHMNRLVQGDVGSGKTLVALMTCLIAIGNGFQTALMAPTEILATQHYESLRDLLKDFPVEVELLTGSTKIKERRRIHENLENGNIQLLVGTHALLEDKVQFKNIGLVVIDEQHRFGVAQRARMWKKNTTPPHILIMTATPIPRTLAMTFYGDLDVSVIDELPPGRKAIQTLHKYEKSRLEVLGLMKREITKGRQVYVVYPLIAESEKLDYTNLMEGHEALQRYFPRPQYQISMVHGKMKPDEKEYEMQRFIKGETQIMVATTVIEVGVNVPNASVMVIESAERFGLSQLHQLRGRVGRGGEQSYCLLVTGDKLSQDTRKRMETMVNSSDGFEIAEVDLQLRGPGDLMGTQQSGMLELKIADLTKDQQLVAEAREKARAIIQKDPELTLEEHRILRMILSEKLKNKPNWGKIA